MLDKHTPIAAIPAQPVSPFDDPECTYVALPEGMRTFSAPSLHDWRQVPGASDLLNLLADGLDACVKGQQPPVIDLSGHSPEARNFVEQVLGEGEISVLADATDEKLNIVESVFTGVWVVKHIRQGKLAQYYLETGAYPAILADWSAARNQTVPFPEAFPQGLMNAPALVHEVFAKSRLYRQGSDEIINLTLLPLTGEDTAYLIETLGQAGISILARGYGDCQVNRTLLPNVWWVQYFNSPGQLILNTLEITALPKVVMAAPEDMEDSLGRLRDLLADMASSKPLN